MMNPLAAHPYHMNVLDINEVHHGHGACPIRLSSPARGQNTVKVRQLLVYIMT